MIKEINHDGFNQAVITHYHEGGECICTLQEVVDEVVVRECQDIVLKDGVHFNLTEEELNILNPQVINELNEEEYA